MENIIEEDKDKISEAVGSEMVQNFLQKYKVCTVQKQNCRLLLLYGLIVFYLCYRASA